MPKRSRNSGPTSRRPPTSRRSASKKRQASAPEFDPNLSAFAALQHVIKATEGTGKNPLAVALGRLGGLKGGRARADKLTKEERRASAVKAARARWDRWQGESRGGESNP